MYSIDCLVVRTLTTSQEVLGSNIYSMLDSALNPDPNLINSSLLRTLVYKRQKPFTCLLFNILLALGPTFYQFLIENTEVYGSTRAANIGTRCHHFMVAVIAAPNICSIHHTIFNSIVVMQ